MWVVSSVCPIRCSANSTWFTRSSLLVQTSSKDFIAHHIISRHLSWRCSRTEIVIYQIFSVSPGPIFHIELSDFPSGLVAPTDKKVLQMQMIFHYWSNCRCLRFIQFGGMPFSVIYPAFRHITVTDVCGLSLFLLSVLQTEISLLEFSFPLKWSGTLRTVVI